MGIFFSKKTKEKNTDILTEAILESEDGYLGFFTPKNVKKRMNILLKNKKLFMGGGTLVAASLFGNVLNYIFNTYTERVLSFSDYSLIGLVGGFLSLASLIFGAYTFTINYNSSFLIGKYGDNAAYLFWKNTVKRTITPSIFIGVIWLFLTPFLMNFFHTNNIVLFLLFSLVLFIGFFSSANQGFLSAKLLFVSLAVLSLADPLIRLTATIGLSTVGLVQWAFATMILSFLIVSYISWLLIRRKSGAISNMIKDSGIHAFPKKIFIVSLISGISSVAYFTFDIFLAKHFLTATEAGQYTLISLVGKMVFFIGGLAGPFITPIVSRYEGAGKNSLGPLYVLTGITAFFSFMACILFGTFGKFTLPILYGEKALVILPYVPLFTFGMACYTISGILVNYYLVKKVYFFTLTPALLVLVQIGLILLFHDSVKTIATVMSYLLIANLLVTVTLHFLLPFIKEKITIIVPAKYLSFK